ncbi:MAG TPA: hypothetical protein VMT37_08445 [Solirubrobacterales bacterium]|nr:hypothetical protein [Solirubrobacterales bacterium]
MGSFRRSLFGYRRLEVDEAFEAREAEILGLQARLADREKLLTGLEGETTSLSGMVVEREREIRLLGERLREANECHDRSIASLDAVTARLEEMQAQARGQATRIRMKALREAVEVSRKVQALTEAHEAAPEVDAAPETPVEADPSPLLNGHADFDGVYEGAVRLEIGPLGDFSQLVGFEDAVGRLGASEISIERFSEGRATLSMRLDQPVELLRELEDLSELDFRVRHTAPDNLVLDVDDEQDPEQRAA